MKLTLPDIQHRGLVPFEGTCLFVDTPTDKPGHINDYELNQHVEVPHFVFKRSAVEAALPTLLGMAVCADEQLELHAIKNKIGVVTEVRLDGAELKISGVLWGLDFPFIVEEIVKRQDALGMCPAFRDMTTDLETTPEAIILNGLIFTGVAILNRANCGFSKTSVRMLPHHYKRPCQEDNCTVMVQSPSVYCPVHFSMRYCKGAPRRK